MRSRLRETIHNEETRVHRVNAEKEEKVREKEAFRIKEGYLQYLSQYSD